MSKKSFLLSLFIGATLALSSSGAIKELPIIHPEHSNDLSEEPSEVLSPEKAEFYRKVSNVKIKTEHGLELYQHWLDQAVSTLFSAVANKNLKEKPKPVALEFHECMKIAKTVPTHAKCITQLLNNKFDGKAIYEKAHSNSHRFDRYRMKKKGDYYRNAIKESSDWVGSFRLRDTPMNDDDVHRAFRQVSISYRQNRRQRRHTNIVRKNYYRLLSPDLGKMSPVGSVAKLLMEGVLARKNKTEKDAVPWQKTVQRIRESSLRKKQRRAKLEENSLEDMEQFAFRGLKQQGLIEDDLEDVIANPTKLKKFLSKKRSKKAREPMERFVELIREGIKLGYMAAGFNDTKFDNKSLKVVSPRFLSVLPEERENTIDFLSPSLFSLHNQGQGIENLTSLPSLVNGFSARDQQEWLNLIIESAGVVENADKIEQELKEEDELKNADGSPNLVKIRERFDRKSRGKDGVPLYFTKENITRVFGSFEERKVDTFERLTLSFQKDQLRELNQSGLAVMSPDQLRLVYGPDSPYNNSEALQRFLKMNESMVHRYLAEDIQRAAEMESFKLRQNDVVLSPVLFTNFILSNALNFNWVVLSPVLFSPVILSPQLFGPIILSPLLFIPFILSPRLLSPLVLAPFMFTPIVLSPLALVPIILSPGLFNPVVLSPAVLSPFILSPQVFSPVILSPLALTPAILTPKLGSPLVLSPYILSPVIYSPQFVSALVLSPYALSPVIQSPLIQFAVILSPSWLS